jgi:hypothetical protein
VSNGVVGSAAFAAYDAGMDVWLGNARSNAPRLHVGALPFDAGLHLPYAMAACCT